MRLRMKVVKAKPARPSGPGFAIFVSVTGAILSEIEHDVVSICRWETPGLAEITSSHVVTPLTPPRHTPVTPGRGLETTPPHSTLLVTLMIQVSGGGSNR
jgi:hypothetical protein